MNKLTWGREIREKNSEITATDTSKSVRSVIIFGTLLCLGFTLTFAEKEPKYAPVSSVFEENSSENENATADPFGYFNGKWNLWEYLGDTFSSLIEL